MRFYFFILCLLGTLTQSVRAQKKTNIVKAKQEQTKKYNDGFPDFDSTLVLDVKPDTTANASFGDFDGDGHLDILLVKGRHWPIVDRILLGDGWVAYESLIT